MTDEVKTRRCIKCKQEKPIYNFQYTPSKFFPQHRSLICTPCLELMVPADSLGEVDRLCQHMDLPFDIDKWTSLYKIHGDHTLTAYFNTLLDDHYSELNWSTENKKWEIAVISDKGVLKELDSLGHPATENTLRSLESNDTFYINASIK